MNPDPEYVEVTNSIGCRTSLRKAPKNRNK